MRINQTECGHSLLFTSNINPQLAYVATFYFKNQRVLYPSNNTGGLKKLLTPQLDTSWRSDSLNSSRHRSTRADDQQQPSLQFTKRRQMSNCFHSISYQAGSRLKGWTAETVLMATKLSQHIATELLFLFTRLSSSPALRSIAERKTWKTCRPGE